MINYDMFDLICNWLKKHTMTVERSAKLKINALILSQLGLVLTFIALALIFYGSQIAINRHTETAIKAQTENINILMNQVHSLSLQTGNYPNEEFVSRGIQAEKADRVSNDNRIEAMVQSNQKEIIQLIRNLK